MTAANWINHVENIGATCPLKELQEAICACPESLYASPLYIFLCGSLMARALDTEDITQIDLTKAPYEGAGAIKTILNPKHELSFKEASSNYGS